MRDSNGKHLHTIEPSNRRTVERVFLGVNVDHVATIREARGTSYPDPLDAARAALRGGADQITIHLREDRRHIQESDLERMREALPAPLNLEMGATAPIVAIACRVRPDTATLVPERREELTTEGGLDVCSQIATLRPVVVRLKDAGIAVSLFIDPECEQVAASAELGVDAVELHTGACCDAPDEGAAARERGRLIVAARAAGQTRMRVCAGHGLHYGNTASIVRSLPEVVEVNIGHAIVARAILVGMEQAVREMKNILNQEWKHEA